MKPTPAGWPRISSSLYYENAGEAIDWLCSAFGFELQLKVEGENGLIEHSELVYGEGLIMAGDVKGKTEKFPYRRSPSQVDGVNTQNMMVYVDDVEAHCRRRREDPRGAQDDRLRRGLLDRPRLRVRGHRRASLVVLPAPARSQAEGMSDLDRTLAALADPMRRGVVELLRKKPRRAGELAESLALSPQAMSRHLRRLRTTGLVEEDHQGEDARVRVYRLRPEPFSALRRWLDDVERFWSLELDAFKQHAERTRGKAKPRR
jgi:DNA-binding transcriptional ArsR family regulator/uncharacterized glyoxalase superfamily protein PhnB